MDEHEYQRGHQHVYLEINIPSLISIHYERKLFQHNISSLTHTVITDSYLRDTFRGH